MYIRHQVQITKMLIGGPNLTSTNAIHTPDTIVIIMDYSVERRGSQILFFKFSLKLTSLY